MKKNTAQIGIQQRDGARQEIAACSNLDDLAKFHTSACLSGLAVDKSDKHHEQDDALGYRGLARDAVNMLSALSFDFDLLAFRGLQAKYRTSSTEVRNLIGRSYSVTSRLVEHVHHRYGCSSGNPEGGLPNVVDCCPGLLDKADGGRKIEAHHANDRSQQVFVLEEISESHRAKTQDGESLGCRTCLD